MFAFFHSHGSLFDGEVFHSKIIHVLESQEVRVCNMHKLAPFVEEVVTEDCTDVCQRQLHCEAVFHVFLSLGGFKLSSSCVGHLLGLPFPPPSLTLQSLQPKWGASFIYCKAGQLLRMVTRTGKERELKEHPPNTKHYITRHKAAGGHLSSEHWHS